jgi:hypothetical protein
MGFQDLKMALRWGKTLTQTDKTRKKQQLRLAF